jgi:L-fuculose-phosphate aldolase
MVKPLQDDRDFVLVVVFKVVRAIHRIELILVKGAEFPRIKVQVWIGCGVDVEQAYWWTEILDAYCRILMLARQLGHVSYFNEKEERELLDLKQKWGWADPRNTEEFKNCDICANDIFRASWKQSGVDRRAFPAPPAMKNASDANPAISAASSAALNAAVSAAVSQAVAAGAPPVLRATPAAAPSAPAASNGASAAGLDMEQLVQLITAQVIRELQK